FGIARAEAAQLTAYRPGIAFPFEDLLPVVIGRPPAVTAVIPAGDPCIGPGSKRNAIGHVHSFPRKKGAVDPRNAAPSQSLASNPMGAKKRHTRAGLPPTAPARSRPLDELV